MISSDIQKLVASPAKGHFWSSGTDKDFLGSRELWRQCPTLCSASSPQALVLYLHLVKVSN